MLARRGDKSALSAGIDALKDADKAVRLAGVQAVARLGAPDAIVTVLATAATEDKEPGVRLAAIKALGDLVNEQTVTLLIPLLLSAQDPGEQATAQRAVAAACGRIPDAEERADALLGALPMAAGPKRIALLRTMSAVGGQKALHAVVADMKNADAAVQEGAVRALAEWPDDSAADTLLAMARGSEKQTEQVLALRGYVRLAGLSSKRPAAQTLLMYKSALDAAKRPEEKRLAIAGLSGVRSVESLKLVAPFIDDPAIQAEAAVAAVRIACPQGGELGLNGPDVAATLQKALPLIKDANVRKQADAYLKAVAR
jgi:HEAT repeat protein